MDFNEVVAGHVDDAAVVQGGVEHGQGFVFRHVDFIEDGEAPHFRRHGNGAFPKEDITVS